MPIRPAHPRPAVPAELLRVPDAASILSLSPRYVFRLVNEGKLASVTIGRSRRVRRSDVEALIRDGLPKSQLK